MKTISALLLIIFLSSCENDRTTKEITEEVIRIRTELLNRKSLPERFLKSRDGENDHPGDTRFYMYFTSRNQNNISDSSVLMSFTIFLDSLEHITFDERHYERGKEDTSFVYTVNKYGEIDWAYKTNPPTSEPTMVEKGDKLLITPSNQPIIEINTDSVYTHIPIKIPDEKTKAFYDARLKVTLDELEKMLFAK